MGYIPTVTIYNNTSYPINISIDNPYYSPHNGGGRYLLPNGDIDLDKVSAGDAIYLTTSDGSLTQTVIAEWTGNSMYTAKYTVVVDGAPKPDTIPIYLVENTQVNYNPRPDKTPYGKKLGFTGGSSSPVFMALFTIVLFIMAIVFVIAIIRNWDEYDRTH
jgi:hypothetical protein